MKNHHSSEAGVSFEIQFGLWIKIWAGEHIFYISQQTIALKPKSDFISFLFFLTSTIFCDKKDVYCLTSKCKMTISNMIE